VNSAIVSSALDTPDLGARRSLRPLPLPKGSEAGVTLMELLIAVTLMSLLSVGIVISFRVALSAMNKAETKLMANRRVAGIERILEEDVAGIMPVTADCSSGSDLPSARIAFFEGRPESMRFVSSYSMQQGARGLPAILEFQVLPGEEHKGVRLIVNERLYTGPLGAGLLCGGAGVFLPIEMGPASFVLADKLAFCRFSYRMTVSPNEPPPWVSEWPKQVLPNAIRFEMAPLEADSTKLQPVTLTIPVHVTRFPLEGYGN